MAILRGKIGGEESIQEEAMIAELWDVAAESRMRARAP